MTLMQLVQRRVDHGRRVLEAVPNPRDLPYPQIVNEGSRALLLGSADLLRVAIRLGEFGFKVQHLTLATLEYEMIDDPELTDELVQAIRSTPASNVDQLMDRYLVDRVVLAIAMLRRQPFVSQIRITQNGALSVPEQAQAEVIADLNRVLGDS